ncbi:SWI/SNF complex protein [Ceratobasidium sp. AG-Ba]|nr:SWI/SNF complex protein [Ceratobasidium sp. AG-Ba]
MATDQPVADVAMDEDANQAKRYLASQTHDIIIPSYSVWFDMASIHSVEKRALPEFFNSRNRSKTPTIYKDYRDFMINAYRMRPAEYLTVTACRRNLAGDVDPETRPSALVPPFTGHFRVTVDTPKGLQPHHPGHRPPLPQQMNNAGSSASGPASLELRKSIYMTTPKSTTGRALTPTQAAQLAQQADAPSQNLRISYACDTCGADCTQLRYHSLTRKNFELCASCYADARFPSSMLSGDFVRLTADSIVQATGTEVPWSDQETLRLLEAIEIHDDDWGAVADQVGTRTREQCIQHFLQLPIEDPYLDDGSVAMAGRVGSEGSLGPLRFARMPFDQAENPVMSVVAFLASAVGPGVAAAASGRAIDEMKKQAEKAAEKERLKEKEKESQAEGEKEKSSEKDVEKDKADGSPKEDTKPEVQQQEKDKSMDVDTSPTSPKGGLSATQTAHLASVALSSSAATASHISATSLASIHSLTAQLLQTQVTKLDLKLAAFSKLEELVAAEREAVRREKRDIAKEKRDVVREKREIEKAAQEVRRAGAEVQRAREEVQAASRRLAQQPQHHQAPESMQPPPEMEMGDFAMNIDMSGMDFSMMGVDGMNVQDVDLTMGGFGEGDPTGMHADGFANLR